MLDGAQRFAVQLARMLSRVQLERWCDPAEAEGVCLGAAALIAHTQQAPEIGPARARELFIANAARLFDAVVEQERAGKPSIVLGG